MSARVRVNPLDTDYIILYNGYIMKKKNPTYTLDWYLKWVASAFVLTGMSVRGISEFIWIDLIASTCGIFLWLMVSILWNDRALILLNGVGLLFLARNAAEYFIL